MFNIELSELIILGFVLLLYSLLQNKPRMVKCESFLQSQLLLPNSLQIQLSAVHGP